MLRRIALNDTCRKGLIKKYGREGGGGEGCGGPKSRGGGLSVFFEPLVKGGSSCFITRIGTHLTPLTTGINSFQLQRAKICRAVAKKDPWLVYNTDGNFM